ncbi:universal stress protein [Actinokineospora auranticolor]|uniref:L-lactate dehydrogenase n=1 Tax=Actinokineospora auranticolor TaxID=155976 RepID=A0A2S6GJ25_9PSEU|nr:universal stress protein [Actinokineospora auranticolor]PPK65156.1 L-lactate dehydrogenase [Actinokineospora auranticolor]
MLLDAAPHAVTGHRGLGGVEGLLIGSVSDAVAAHARCPVVVVRGTAGPIVFGVDGSRAGGAAIGFALEQAAGRGEEHAEVPVRLVVPRDRAARVDGAERGRPTPRRRGQGARAAHRPGHGLDRPCSAAPRRVPGGGRAHLTGPVTSGPVRHCGRLALRDTVQDPWSRSAAVSRLGGVTDRRAARGPRIAVVGAGQVGSTLAYACQIRGTANTVALFDTDAAKLRAQVLDLRHGGMFAPTVEVVGSDDVGICAGADVVVITAGARQRAGESRMALAGRNVRLCRALVPELCALAPEAVFLVVTNPVDVVTQAVLEVSGLPAHRVLGSGTVLDSSRLRALIAARAGVGVAGVCAYIVGEHGDTAVPLWSQAFIGSVPVLDWVVDGRQVFDEPARREIEDSVVGAAYEVIAGKGATNYAVGLAVTHVLEAILGDQRLILPVSAYVADFHGIGGVCLSLPRIVDRSGAGALEPTVPGTAELAGLRRCAHVIAKACRESGVDVCG